MTGFCSVHRWRDLPLQKVTAMISRKVISSDRQMLIQAYLKRGVQIPRHTHQHDQMVYVLQGSIRCLVGTKDVTVREGEVLHVPGGIPHQVEVVEDTLADLGLSDKPRLLVMNKMDLLGNDNAVTARALLPGVYEQPSVLISARKKWNIESLLEEIESRLVDIDGPMTVVTSAAGD